MYRFRASCRVAETTNAETHDIVRAPCLFTVARLLAIMFGGLGFTPALLAQSLDTSFNPGANSYISALAVQADGKIVVGGNFTTLGGGGIGTTARNRIGRLNADGSLDTSFNPTADSDVNAVAIQPDGNIVVGGSFTTLGGVRRSKIGRLNADGSIDASFNPGATNNIFALTVQSDGRILVGGYFTMLGGGGTGTIARNRIGRLNADGSVDTSFDPGADSLIHGIAVQVDGKILVGGYFTTLGGGGSGTTVRNHIGRLNSNGSLDTSFNPGANADVGVLVLQADGKILVGGDFTMLGGGGTGITVRTRIGRLNSDGSLDTSFDPVAADNSVATIVVDGGGRILVGGHFTTFASASSTTARSKIGRLNADGSLDLGFNPGANNVVFVLAVQGDGKIVVGGTFTMMGGGGSGTTARNRIGRLNADAVIPAPSVTTHPSNQWTLAGATASFSAAASGSPSPTVQWQRSNDNGSTFNDITGATATTYSFAAGTSDDGAQFRAIFTNSAGSATTNVATLTVTSQVSSLARISLNSDGTEARAFVADSVCALGSFSPQLSADGRYVAFTSTASNLVPNDTNNAPDHSCPN